MRVLVGQGQDGSTGMVLNDETGKMRAVFGQWQNNPPVLFFQSLDGQPLWMAPPQNPAK